MNNSLQHIILLLSTLLLFVIVTSTESADVIHLECNNPSQVQNELCTASDGGGCFRKCCPEKYELDVVNCSGGGGGGGSNSTRRPSKNQCRKKTVCRPNVTITADYIIKNHPKMMNKWSGGGGGDLHVITGKCPSSKSEILDWFPNGTVKTNNNLTLANLHCFDYLNDGHRPRHRMVVLFEWHPRDDDGDEESRRVFGVRLRQLMVFICLLVSIIFLFCTFTIFALIPKKKNIHEKCMMHQVISLFVGFLVLLVRKVNEIRNILNEWTCIIVGFSLQFFILASFFWLNVMCFDIWRSLGRLEKTQIPFLKNDSTKFLYYCLYAWGSPTLITVVTILRAFVFESIFNIFSDACFFDDIQYPKLFHFNIFIMLIMIVNVILFLTTAISIEKFLRSRMIGNSEAKLKSDKRRLILYVQLFVIMGLSWILDLMCASREALAKYTNIIVSLQGVFVFLIFVCKKRIFLAVQGRFSQAATITPESNETPATK